MAITAGKEDSGERVLRMKVGNYTQDIKLPQSLSHEEVVGLAKQLESLARGCHREGRLSLARDVGKAYGR